MIVLWVLTFFVVFLLANVCYLAYRLDAANRRIVSIWGDLKAGNDIHIGEPK